ncbi:MAG: glucose-1-phosphate adenylyltransferase subunit GlgD [Coriobacteriia bacterium]|nr:glucose-1-phosphate adenylyltransferase subunit GlgD [Coriobacteriia bacterium]
MIRDAFGIIYAAEEVPNLRELIDLRTIAALPIGGKYRAIDFPLSNMVNSDIRSVGVIVSRNYNSLMDHLGSGKEWDLSRKSDGLFILTPFARRENPGVYRGEVEALRSSIDFLRKTRHEYCVLAGASSIFSLTYDEMMRFHIDNGADITALYQRVPSGDQAEGQNNEVFLDVSKEGRVQGIEIDPVSTTLTARSLKSYIVRRDTLIYLIDDCYSKGEYRFHENLLRNNLSRLKIMGFEHKGYVGVLRSVPAYFDINMDMLDPTVREELFSSNNLIYTKTKDSVPAKYTQAADVKQSLIANECIIEGTVENAVLFRNVHVGHGSKIKNSIILAGSVVGEGAELEYVILDKDVSIRPGSRLVGTRNYPVVIRKGAMV